MLRLCVSFFHSDWSFFQSISWCCMSYHIVYVFWESCYTHLLLKDLCQYDNLKIRILFIKKIKGSCLSIFNFNSKIVSNGTQGKKSILGSSQTILLCIVGELAGEGSNAVAVAVVLVTYNITGDKPHSDMGNLIPDFFF